jgi:hypothetical protein
MGFPAGSFRPLHIDEVKLDKEVHGSQHNLTPSWIQRLQNDAQMAHGSLFGCQSIYQGTARHKIPVTK